MALRRSSWPILPGQVFQWGRRPGGSGPRDVPPWPVSPGQSQADQTFGSYWRDRTPGGGGGGGQGAASALLGPPPGTYDPQLDASLRASDRGLDYFKQDTERQGTRALEDYGVQREDTEINRGRFREDTGLARSDIGTEYGRAMEDVGTQRGDVKAGFGRQLSELQRQYEFLGNRQRQQGTAAGIQRGGFAEQAAGKRAANFAFDKGGIDMSLGQALRNLDTSEGRIGENRNRALQGLDLKSSRGEQDYTRLLGPEGSPRDGLLYQGYSRGVEDRTTGLTRAIRENREFGQDIGASKYYQARYGAGTLPIWNPRGGGPKKRSPYARRV